MTKSLILAAALAAFATTASATGILPISDAEATEPVVLGAQGSAGGAALLIGGLLVGGLLLTQIDSSDGTN